MSACHAWLTVLGCGGGVRAGHTRPLAEKEGSNDNADLLGSKSSLFGPGGGDGSLKDA